MAGYGLSVEAREDAVNIWCHIAADRPQAADRQLARIRQSDAQCAQFPGLGRRRSDLGPDYHALAVDRYILIYHPIATDILIDRILHASRDIDTEFSE